MVNIMFQDSQYIEGAYNVVIKTDEAFESVVEYINADQHLSWQVDVVGA